MMLSYTARRSLVPPHVAGDAIAADFGVSGASRSRQAEKHVKRAANGRTETLHLYTDQKWVITFSPVRGAEKDLLAQFLDSTAGGEEFTAWIYGDEASPVRCTRADSGYSWQPFMETGARMTDLFTTSITILEAA